MKTREFLKISWALWRWSFLLSVTPAWSRELAWHLEEENHELYNPSYAKKLERDRARYELYIDQYRATAQEEQELYWIPASISLAQALNETDAGISKLASKDNNHFWIKCKEDWPHPHGKNNATCSIWCVHHEDDTHNDYFLQYRSSRFSRRWHSKKLKESTYKNGNKIYWHLFDKSKTQCIEDRCRGLQVYSSSSTYPSSLRTLITFFDLTKYDKPKRKKER